MKLNRVLAVALAAGALACEKLPEIPNVPPSAEFVYSPVSPINAGSTNVVFNASGSRDTDGSVANYAWDFGDGSAQETTNGPTVTHVFRDTPTICQEITYTVLLTVRDDDGDIGTANQRVTVTELPRPESQACDVPLGR
jgi:PKD repeat protein